MAFGAAQWTTRLTRSSARATHMRSAGRGCWSGARPWPAGWRRRWWWVRSPFGGQRDRASVRQRASAVLGIPLASGRRLGGHRPHRHRPAWFVLAALGVVRSAAVGCVVECAVGVRGDPFLQALHGGQGQCRRSCEIKCGDLISLVILTHIAHARALLHLDVDVLLLQAAVWLFIR